jgi:rubrerythrin
MLHKKMRYKMSAGKRKEGKAMETKELCYTRDAALEKAIEMEANSFRIYRSAYSKVQDEPAKALIKELALEELEHKYLLEKAFFEEVASLHDSGLMEAPSMKFVVFLEEKPLGEQSGAQDVLTYAIHDEQRSVDFYKHFFSQCRGAPMEELFERLAREEEKHLARLEEMYERLYLPEM